MSTDARRHRLSAEDLETILGVTSALAAPFDLMTMLGEVVNAAKQVLHADRGSVWLVEPATDELVLLVATGIAPVRVGSGAGLVGACARERRIINVPDCYADPRLRSLAEYLFAITQMIGISPIPSRGCPQKVIPNSLNVSLLIRT